MSRSPYRTNPKEVADYKGVDEETIRRRCRNGVIPAIKDGQWKILTSWFEEEKRRERQRYTDPN
jgi:hypothetical protein